MATHIHIHTGKTKDAGPAHAPAGSSKGGQFVSGSGGGGAKARPNSSGVEVKHQSSGTEVKHQAHLAPASTPYEKKQARAAKKIDDFTPKTHPHPIGSDVTMHTPSGPIDGKVTSHSRSNGHPVYMVKSDQGTHQVDVSEVTAKEK